MKYILIISVISLFIASCNNDKDVKSPDSSYENIISGGTIRLDSAKPTHTIRGVEKSELDERPFIQERFIGQESDIDVKYNCGRIKKMGGLANLTDTRFFSYKLLKDYRTKTYTIFWGVNYDGDVLDADFLRKVKRDDVNKEIIRLAKMADKMIGEVEDF